MAMGLECEACGVWLGRVVRAITGWVKGHIGVQPWFRHTDRACGSPGV